MSADGDLASRAGHDTTEGIVSIENPGDGQRCDHCDRPGTPYEYEGERFPGLHANRGEMLCGPCLNRAVDAETNKPVGWARMPAHRYVIVRSPTGYETRDVR